MATDRAREADDAFQALPPEMQERLRKQVAAKRAHKRARVRTEIGNVIGSIGGHAPQSMRRERDLTPQYNSLTKQYEALIKAEGDAGMDPLELLKAKLDYLKEVMAQTTKRLDTKATQYTRAQIEREKLRLEALDKQIKAVDANLDTTIAARKKEGTAGDGAGVVDQQGIMKALTSLGKSAQFRDPDRFANDILAASVAQKMNPATEDVFFQLLDDAQRTGDFDRGKYPIEDSLMGSIITGLNDQLRDADGQGVPEIRAQLPAIRQRIATMGGPQGVPAEAIQAVLPPGAGPSVVRAIEQTYFNRVEDPDGTVRYVLDESVIEDAPTTVQAISEQYEDLIGNLSRNVTGSGGGPFGEQMLEIMGAHDGARTLPEFFDAIGFSDEDIKAESEAQQASFRSRSEDVLKRLERLKEPTGYAGHVYHTARTPDFEKATETYGSDPFKTMQKLERATARDLRDERRGGQLSFQDEKKRRRQDRVIAELGGARGGSIA